MKLLRNTKNEFYNNLNLKYITEDKLFWKTVKPSFVDKILKDKRLILVENNAIISDENELVAIFSKYFGNIIQNLGIDGLDITITITMAL